MMPRPGANSMKNFQSRGATLSPSSSPDENLGVNLRNSKQSTPHLLVQIVLYDWILDLIL